MLSPSPISLFDNGAAELVATQDGYTAAWHHNRPAVPPSLAALELAVAGQHLANFELWHAEDSARAPGLSNEDVARIKRFIDATNQRRNDLTERCDALLLKLLEEQDLPKLDAELHSESPGLIIDRLSILSLKIFHTEREIERLDAPPGHGERNRQRALILGEQREDLAASLGRLWRQVLAGERRFKLYRQLKMYNDPALNPAVYSPPRQSS